MDPHAFRGGTAPVSHAQERQAPPFVRSAISRTGILVDDDMVDLHTHMRELSAREAAHANSSHHAAHGGHAHPHNRDTHARNDFGRAAGNFTSLQGRGTNASAFVCDRSVDVGSAGRHAMMPVPHRIGHAAGAYGATGGLGGLRSYTQARAAHDDDEGVSPSSYRARSPAPDTGRSGATLDSETRVRASPTFEPGLAGARMSPDTMRTHMRSRSATVRWDKPRMSGLVDARADAIGLGHSMHGPLATPHFTATMPRRLVAGDAASGGTAPQMAAPPAHSDLDHRIDALMSAVGQAEHSDAVPAGSPARVPTLQVHSIGQARAAAAASVVPRTSSRRPFASARLPTSHLELRRQLDTARPPTRQRNAFPTFLSDLEVLRDIHVAHSSPQREGAAEFHAWRARPPAASALSPPDSVGSASGERPAAHTQALARPPRPGPGPVSSPLRMPPSDVAPNNIFEAPNQEYSVPSSASQPPAPSAASDITQQLNDALAAMTADPASARRAAFYEREVRLARQHRARARAAAAGIVSTNMAFDAMVHGMDTGESLPHHHTRRGPHESHATAHGLVRMDDMRVDADQRRSLGISAGFASPSTRVDSAWTELPVDFASNSGLDDMRSQLHTSSTAAIDPHPSVRSLGFEGNHDNGGATPDPEPASALHSRGQLFSAPSTAAASNITRHTSTNLTASDPGLAWGGEDGFDDIPVTTDVPIVISGGTRSGRESPDTGIHLQASADTSALYHEPVSSPVHRRRPPTATGAAARMAGVHGDATPESSRHAGLLPSTAASEEPRNNGAGDNAVRMEMWRSLLDRNLTTSATTRALASSSRWEGGTATGSPQMARRVIDENSPLDAGLSPLTDASDGNIPVDDDASGDSDGFEANDGDCRLEDTTLDEQFLALFANGRELLSARSS